MSNFSHTSNDNEVMGGAIYNFFGHVLPDFGFPDKQMWNNLMTLHPEQNWDRGQVYDLYKWYQTGIEAGEAPYDIDTNNRQIFSWIKNNSTYTNAMVNSWADVFATGILNNWIEGKYIGTKLAPAHEGREISEGVANIPKVLGNISDRAFYLALAGTGLLVAFYGMPIVAKAFKGKRKTKRKVRYA